MSNEDRITDEKPSHQNFSPKGGSSNKGQVMDALGV